MKKLGSKNIVGFCKTSSLLTEKGNSVIALMNMHKGKFAYHPVAELFDETYFAKICFARLHENSKYVFKLDFNNEISEEILDLLAENSKDPVFLGYPYGFVLADKLARVSNEEANYVRAKFISKIKNEDLLRYLNALNAHDVLDKI
jgi:NurA-like 5'-3' nuclease